MTFSIIIPAHNAADRITHALDTIAAQSFKDYEIIVPCDSCDDNTEEIASAYGAFAFPVEFRNDGLTRNAGLDVATGEWILFLDDDDWYLHEFVFQQLADRIKENRGDIICFAFIWKGIGYASPTSCHGTLYPSVWNKCWRRTLIGSTRFKNIFSISDAHFHAAMMSKLPALDIWDMPMVYYNYLRAGSISEQVGRTLEETKAYWGNN